MKPFSNDTIILLFSRFAEEEAKEKKYASILGKKRGTALASELIRHTLKEARDTALPVMPFFSDQQKGNTFAERLTDAIERTFALGYNNIIISGTDSPSVNSKQLEKVAEKLQATQLILAPSNDGGVYLIGINNNANYQRLQNKLDILHNISDGLNEVKQTKNTGKKLQTLKDFLK